MSEQRNQTLVNGCHNASISTAQRRVNSGRKDVIVQSNNNLNVFSEQILEAKAQVDRKRMSARVSFQKKKNENKRKMLSLQTDAVQLQTEIDKLSSAVELVKLEEGQKIEKAHSYRMNLKKNHRSLREERKEKHSSFTVYRTVYALFNEEFEEFRKRKSEVTDQAETETETTDEAY